MKWAKPLINIREYTTTFIVAALVAWFGAALTMVGDTFTSSMRQIGADGLQAVAVALSVVTWIFLGIALFIGAMVTANTFSTLIAGRAKRLALMRLLGASSRSLRSLTLIEGLVIGIIGAVIGTALGTSFVQACTTLAKNAHKVPQSVDAAWFSWQLVATSLAVVTMTAIAATVGSRRVLQITPIQAFGTASAATETSEGSSKTKYVVSLVIAIFGCVLLAIGTALGVSTPLGVLIAFPGGAMTFIALMVAADKVLPPLLQLGSGWGRGAATRLAARNTMRNPRRSSRSTIGIVIGVGLITMFAVAGYTYRDMITEMVSKLHKVDATTAKQIYDVFSIPVTVAMALVAFSVVLAAIGLINNQLLSTIQRQHEIGLLRALGLTRGQVNAMTTLESMRMSVIATIVGLVLGAIYGWLGCVSMLGSLMNQAHHWLPTFPWMLGLGVLVGSFVLSAIAALVASRRAVRVSPVEALRAD